jgi:hypothetical protein
MEVALDDVAHQFEEWACIQKKSAYFFGIVYSTNNVCR